MHLARFRPRFRLWWLMAAVAVVALILAGQLTLKRSEALRKKAEDFACLREQEEMYGKYWIESLREYRQYAEGFTLPRSLVPRFASSVMAAQKELEQIKKKVAYYKRLEEKYRRAAAFPWLTVEPDPPEPD